MSFAGLFTNNAPAQPATQGKFSGLFSAPTGSSQPVSQSSIPQTAPKVSGSTGGIPNQALEGNLGGGYGTSNIKDSSGKPLLTFENQNTQSSQLFNDRTAPTFNPSVAQKVDPKILQNGRMPESVSQQIKSQFPYSTASELDHIMPLELGGSNDKSNLQLERGASATKPYSPGKNPTTTDPLENALKEKATKGDISLVDAWRLMAQAKGLELPEDGGMNLASGSTANLDRTATPEPLINKLPGLIRDIGSGKESTAMSMFNEIGGNAIVHPLQTIKAIGDKVMADGSAAVSNLFHAAAEAIVNGQTAARDSKDGDKNAFTNPKNAAGVLNLFSAAASTFYMPVSETFSIASQLPVIKPVADGIGLIFDKTGKVAQFASDKMLDGFVSNGLMKQSTAEIIRKPIDSVSTLLGQIVLGGYIYGKITNLTETKGGVTENDATKIASEAQAKAEEINNSPEVPKPTLTDIVQKDDNAPEKVQENPVKPAAIQKPSEPIASEKDSVNNEVLKQKTSSIPKELQPLAEEARKYKSVEEFVKNNDLVFQGGPKGAKSAFWSTNIGEANAYANQASMKGPGEIRVARFSDIAPEYRGDPTQEDWNGVALDKPEYTKASHVITVAKDQQPPIIGTIEPDKTGLKSDKILTDFYNQATKGNETISEANPKVSDEIVKQKEITKMRTGALRPIEGTGKVKIRGLSEGVESKLISNTPSKLPSFAPEEAIKLEQAQVASKLTDMFGDLPQYKQMDVADQGAKAIALFEKDPEGAKQIAYGAKTPPKGLTPEAVFVAVEQDAIERGDIQTLKELANSRLTQEATTMGQRIRMLAERNPESPTDAIRAVQEARVKAVQDKVGKPVEEAKADVVKEIREKISSARPKRIAWSDFVQEITC